ncbi:pilus assembly protein PilM [Lignipirellula cremea]|uniref:pilus assembly protein PilM n=1 Tax=Lignipirellula cremea TaxID=2528010 RepID=UPI0018D2245D|nr:pilus assembly protein PilM [Lignipirellula cremea]
MASQLQTIACFQCDKSNSPDRNFCGHCGHSLWAECEQCSARYSSGEVFCGGCGVNLADNFKEKREATDAWWRSIQEARDEGRYDDAMGFTAKIAKSTHARLATDAAKAQKLLRELRDERDQRIADAVGLVEKAQQLYDNHAYESAYIVLDKIPKSLRTPEAKNLFRQAYDRNREVLTLSGAIREAVDNKQYDSLMPLVDRMLRLQPAHEKAKAIGAKVALYLAQVAAKRCEKHQYQEALDIFCQIPESFQTEKITALGRKVEELAWLWDDICSTGKLTPTVSALLDRLLELAPGHPAAARLKGQIQAQTANKPGAAIALKAPPERPHLGVLFDAAPAQWRGLEIDDAVRKTLSPASDYFVAVGLALQGLGKARLGLQLAEAQKKQSFFSLSLSRRAPKRRVAWGIDVGGSRIKAVRLSLGEGEEHPTVERGLQIEIPLTERFQGDDLTQVRLISDSLEKLITAEGIGEEILCVSVPGVNVLCRYSNLPPLETSKVAETVKTEVATQIPFPITELSWDYQTLSSSDDPDLPASADSDKETSAADDPAGDSQPQAEKKKLLKKKKKKEEPVARRVMLMAAKNVNLEPILRPFKEKELQLSVLQSDGLALYNCLDYFAQAKQQETGAPAAVEAYLDLGARWSNFLVMGPGVVWFRSFRTGGDSFSKALVSHFQLTHPQAEQVKCQPAQARSLSRMYGALSPVFQQLTEEVRLCLLGYEKAHPDQPLTRIRGLGGSFQIHGMLRCLHHGTVTTTSQAPIA